MTKQKQTTEGQESADEEMERWIDASAEKIVRLRLEPAVDFFLESHLPASSLIHNLGLVLQPLVTPLFGAERISHLNELFSKREHIERLQARIAEKAAARTQTISE